MFVFRRHRERRLPLPTAWTLCCSWSYSWSASSQSVRTGNKKKNKKKTQQVGFELLSVYENKKKWIAALFFSEHYEPLPFGCWSLPHRAVSVKMHSVISPSSRTRRLFDSVRFFIRTFTLSDPIITSGELYHAAATVTVQINSMNHPFWVWSLSHKHFVVDFAFKRRAALCFFFFLFFFFSLMMAAGNDCNWGTECIVCVALEPDQECLPEKKKKKNSCS